MNPDQDSGPTTACLNGHPDEFGKIVGAHKAGVMATAINILGNREDAKDVCQETFIQVFRNLGHYDPQKSFKNWILTILYRRCLDQLKKKRRLRSVLQRVSLELPKETPAGASNPGEKGHLRTELLNHLSPKERTALALWANEGFTGPEISDVLGCSPSTARVYLYNARKKVKSILEKSHEALKNH